MFHLMCIHGCIFQGCLTSQIYIGNQKSFSPKTFHKKNDKFCRKKIVDPKIHPLDLYYIYIYIEIIPIMANDRRVLKSSKNIKQRVFFNVINANNEENFEKNKIK